MEDGTHDDPVLGRTGLRPGESERPPGGGLDPGGSDRAGHGPAGRDGSPDEGADGGVREPAGPADRTDDAAAVPDETEPGDRRVRAAGLDKPDPVDLPGGPC